MGAGGQAANADAGHPTGFKEKASSVRPGLTSTMWTGIQQAPQLLLEPLHTPRGNTSADRGHMKPTPVRPLPEGNRKTERSPPGHGKADCPSARAATNHQGLRAPAAAQSREEAPGMPGRRQMPT